MNKDKIISNANKKKKINVNESRLVSSLKKQKLLQNTADIHNEHRYHYHR